MGWNHKSLEKLLYYKDENIAFETMKEAAEQIVNGTYDPISLILTKQVGKEEYKVKQPHIEAARRKYQREHGTDDYKPTVGEWISYMIVNGPKRNALNTKSEDPFYVIQSHIEIDHNYYLEKQVIPPLEKVFSVCCHESLVDKIKQLKNVEKNPNSSKKTKKRN